MEAITQSQGVHEGEKEAMTGGVSKPDRGSWLVQ